MTTAPLRVALCALGCKVNFAEMAELAGALAAAGLVVVDEHEPADVRVLNSCAVTATAEATTRQRLRRWRRLDPSCTLVVTGCAVDTHRFGLAGTAPRAPDLPGADVVFANADKSAIADWIVTQAGERRGAGAAAPGLRARYFLKVQDGCDHRCSYCSVWRARDGRSRSLPLPDVLRRAAAAVTEGYREVVLCGVDLGGWGRDLVPRQRLADLVRSLLDELGDAARVRLSSVNANDVTPDLAELTGHPRLCSHWHLPVQSGSDAVLRAMRRGYRVAGFRRVVSWLRRADGDCEVTTDIMVGFPGETEDDHRATVALVEELELLHAHVFRWSPRPETPAARLPGRIDEVTARRRSREVRAAAARSGYRRRVRALGSVAEVVWEVVEHGTARGTSDRWFTVLAPAGEATRPGRVGRVRLERVVDETIVGQVIVAGRRPSP